MEEPSPRSSRLTIAAGLVAALLVGGAGFLLGRGSSEASRVVTPPVIAVRPQSPPVMPAPKAELDRAGLIDLAAAAADAVGGGRDFGPEIAEAEGRRFEVRLPFGCDGPTSEDSDAVMRWQYDEEDGVLRVAVEPHVWTAQDWWSRAAPPEGLEAIEGFWVARPWTSSEACPAAGSRPAPTGTEPLTLPGQTLALGQPFYADGQRSGRRNGKPYEAVSRVSRDALDVSRGFRLKLRGRIAQGRNGGSVRCRQPAGPEQRPICLVNVLMDEIAIENPARDETLATWTLPGRETRNP